ncbi:MAG: ATP-binding protein [Deltaproteobacteria bacterium]|nr:ATP-binding protein [Deltaproteobacteria bacterium]
MTILSKVVERLKEPRRFLQVLLGPRQVGKTTIARQVIDEFGDAAHYASADEPTIKDRVWVEQQWDVARLKSKRVTGTVLIVDEVQKVSGWAEVVKYLWDADTHAGTDLKVLLLGSSPLLVARGLNESLAGRFEIVRVPHWSFGEMRDAFGWDLDRYVYFGGYPGAAALCDDRSRWAAYINDALIETTISRDILLMTRVDKPALLRRLFQLACVYSAQILSYQAMLGQLAETGNTTTLAHYLDLLDGAGMVRALQKFSGSVVRQRASSPKLLVRNNALMSAQSHRSFEAAIGEREWWGRLVESAVGAHLVNGLEGSGAEVFYWREKDAEVDFVVRANGLVTAIEVKSGTARVRPKGMEVFDAAFGPGRKLLVGGQGIPLDEFLSRPPAEWVT